MRLGCPVGHPSGSGKHCPLCGRQYVHVPDRPTLTLPSPRSELVLPQRDDPRPELEAWELLRTLAMEAAE